MTLFRLTDIEAEESKDIDYDFLYDMALKMYMYGDEARSGQVTIDAINNALDFIKRVETFDAVTFRYGKLVMKIERIKIDES